MNLSDFSDNKLNIISYLPKGFLCGYDHSMGFKCGYENHLCDICLFAVKLCIFNSSQIILNCHTLTFHCFL